MLQRRGGKATAFVLLAASIVAASFIGAITLGGNSVLDAVHDASSATIRSRCITARAACSSNLTFTQLLFDYPFGAGLGRWGMAGAYFGNPALPGIWAEIQITGWMIDGGMLMTVLYTGALVSAAASQYRLAMQTRYPRIAVCSGVVFAANLGIAAMVFSFTPFVTQIGIQVPVPRWRAARCRVQLPAAERMSDWLLIAGDFTPLGGMDRANHALAMHLARERTGCVNLVAHRAWPDLAAQPSVRFHPVRRPLGSNLLGAPLVASAGERQARSCARSMSLRTAGTLTPGM